MKKRNWRSGVRYPSPQISMINPSLHSFQTRNLLTCEKSPKYSNLLLSRNALLEYKTCRQLTNKQLWWGELGWSRHKCHPLLWLLFLHDLRKMLCDDFDYVGFVQPFWTKVAPRSKLHRPRHFQSDFVILPARMLKLIRFRSKWNQ